MIKTYINKNLFLTTVIFLCFFAGCTKTTRNNTVIDGDNSQDIQSTTISLGDDLSIVPVTKGVYRHISKMEIPGFGLTPSNGLIIITGSGAILIDTPWTNEQTQRLIKGIKKSFGVNVGELVITHSHDDRMGGIDEAISSGITTRAFTLTGELALKAGSKSPQILFGPSEQLDLMDEKLEVFYPGSGHSPDNIVVWLSDKKILFAGCFVRDATTDNLGSSGTADLASWKSAIEKVMEHFPSAEIVIPGHGEPAGKEILIHTHDLINHQISKTQQ